MDKINELIEEKNAKFHINNMVGTDLKKSEKIDKKCDSDAVLERLKKVQKSSRILLDLLAVSITPKKAKNNWTMIDTKSNDLVQLAKHGRYDFRPNGKMENLGIDEFFEYFKKTFEGILDMSEGYTETGGGAGGYNDGRVYELGGTSAKIHFRYFNPDKAKEGITYKNGAFENYIRQRINVKLTGDGLQYLRSQGNLLNYILKLYTVFESSATMFDVALDMFNYKQTTSRYVGLYRKKQYLGKAKVNTFGHVDNPTVYVGAYKGDRTVMMYDKLQEARDAEKSDEPELVEILEETDGNWFRLEQHFATGRREAEQAFGFIVHTLFEERKIWDIDLEKRFIELLSTLLKTNVEKKCRFITEPRKEKNNERIDTHKKWGEILQTIETVEMDFAFMRPEITLEQRMLNYKYKSLGGNQFHEDVIDELGEEKYINFMNDVARHHIKRAREKEQNGE